MRAVRGRHAQGQSLLEFALVLPVLLLIMFGTIDYAAYFSSRLSVENATRAAVRLAVTDACGTWNAGTSSCGNTYWSTASSPAAGTIEALIIAKANYPVNIPNVDCYWLNNSDGNYEVPSSTNKPGTTTASLPPGKLGCITIVYFNIQSAAETLCGWWDANTAPTGWNWTNIATYGPSGSGATNPCVGPGSLVQVTVMWHYTPLTPVPGIASHILDTTATIQLTEED